MPESQEASPPIIGRESLAAIFQTTPDCIFFKDLNLRYVSVNPAMERLLNLPAEKLIGADDVELFGAEAGARILESDRRVLAGETLTLEDRKSVGDACRTFRVTKNPVRDHTGAVLGLCGVAADITDLKQAEERYRTLVENVPIGLYRTTPDGRLQDANPALVEMLGYSSSEMERINLNSEAYAPSYDRAEFIKRMERDGESVGLETAWKRRDGSIIHLRENVRAIRDDDGRVAYYEGSLENVSDRVLIEQELLKVLDQTKLALWGADLTAWDWNVPTDTLVFSARLAEMLGYKVEEMPHHLATFDLLRHPDDRAATAARRKRYLEGKSPFFEAEYRLKTKAGEWKWMSSRGKIVERDDAGRPTRVAGVLRDITERIRAEEELRRAHDGLEERVRRRTALLAEAVTRLHDEIAERRQAVRQLAQRTGQLQSLADNSPDLISRVDHYLRYVFVNCRMAELLGRSPDDVLGHSTRELTYLNEPDNRRAELFREVIETARPLEFESTRETPTGTRSYQIHLAPEFNDSGIPDTVLETARDITEFKHAREQLDRSQRLASIGTLAAGVAHEINNPAGGILMAAQAALKTPRDQEFVTQCLRDITKDATRCGQIVKSMLRFSRQQPTEKQPNNINVLIHQAAEHLREIIREHDGSLNLVLDDAVTDVALNPIEFEQLLINLIRNAVEIGERGACVTVRTKKTNDCMRLTISDDGPGMSPDQLRCIFDPFYTTRQQKGGMGLGLSVVHGIVEAHGGDISVDSSPNQGTTFTIKLPF